MVLLTYYSDLKTLCCILDTLHEHTTIKWTSTGEDLDNPDVMMMMSAEGILRIEDGCLGVGRTMTDDLPIDNAVFINKAIVQYGFHDTVKNEDPVDDGCRSCKYFYAEEWCGLEPTPVRIQNRIDIRCRHYVKKEGE